MRILWIAPYSPWPPFHGGKVRIFNLIRCLLTFGHSVELWCIADEKAQWPNSDDNLQLRSFQARERISAWMKFRQLVSPYPEGSWSMLTRESNRAIAGISSDDYDVAVLEQSMSGVFAADLINAGIPCVVDAQNVDWWLLHQIALISRRPQHRLRLAADSKKYRALEQQLLRAPLTVVAVSSEDEGELRDLGNVARTAVHPNGVDLDYFSWSDHSLVREGRLIMTGSLGYSPNEDAIRWFCSEVMPRLRKTVSVHLDLVGSAPSSNIHKLHDPGLGINVVGPVGDIRPFLTASDVFVIPLRIGSGTRLKAVEALAAGIPVISTRLGVAGLGIAERQLATIRDRPDDFAAGILELLADQDLRSRMSIEGRAYVEEAFSWDRIAQDFATTLEQAASDGDG